MVLLAIEVAVLWPMQNRATQQLVATNVRSLAGSLAATYGVFDHQRGMHPAADAVDEIAHLELLHSVVIRDAQGKIRHEMQRPEQPTGATVTVTRPLQRLSSCSACHAGEGGSLGEIVVVADLDQAAIGLQETRVASLLTLALVVCGIVLAIVLLARRMITTPLVDLARTMSRAREGDFLVRAQTDRSDEIGELSKAFNKMLAAITDLQASGLEQELDLKQAQQELELKQELEQKNQQFEETNSHLQRRLEEISLLMDLTRAVTSTLELRAVLDEISQSVGKAMGVDEFAILLLDPRGRRLNVKSTYGVPNKVKLTKLHFALGEGISGRVAQSGSSILVPDTTQDPRYLYYKGMRPVDGSFLSVPMITKGKVLGVLDFFRAKPNAFSKHSVALLTAVAGQAALAIENAKLFSAQTELAMTDGLTGLFNRRTLDQRIAEEVHRARRFQNDLSVLMIDVDHFKQFNDKHGHLLGDHVLKQLARTLRQRVRKVDTLARYGGEEFCVVLVRTSSKRAASVAEKLRAAVAKRIFARIRADRKIKITISIGLASLSEGMEGPRNLIDAADAALYRAKSSGRNRVYIDEASRAGLTDE